MYGSFNPPQGPAKSAQRKDLLFLFFAQDIHRRRIILRLSQFPGSAIPLAAFQVSTDGRSWVSTEAGLEYHEVIRSRGIRDRTRWCPKSSDCVTALSAKPASRYLNSTRADRFWDRRRQCTYRVPTLQSCVSHEEPVRLPVTFTRNPTGYLTPHRCHADHGQTVLLILRCWPGTLWEYNFVSASQ